MKRVVSYLLIVSMLFSLVGTGVCNVGVEEAKAASSYTVTELDFTYCYITFNDSEEEYIGISSYIGNDTDVVIPDKIEGCTVISIEQSAFEGCDKIKSIVLPDSITTIEEWAFYGCSSLQKINIPESVVGIGAHAFRNCKELKEIHLPDSIQYIDEEAFLSTGLLQIDIPESVEKIDCGAFANTQISEVIFKRPDVLIADCAFRCYGEEGYTTNIKVIGIKDSTAEVFARHVSAVFESIDGKYKKDYGIQNYCYDTAVANYEATIEFLDEYYIQKYPNLALEPLYGGEKEHKMFREIAENIVAKDTKHTEPEALYNWMNENILLNGQYGYPLDVYNFKSADCYGNATLLCELLRSIDIPAVVVTGYTGDTVSTLTEKMFVEEEVTKHAWVLTYYGGAWQLLDSGMDRMISSKEEICRWYYTLTVDSGLAICSDFFNSNVEESLACFKDGEFFAYWERCLYCHCDGYLQLVYPEWVFNKWLDLNGPDYKMEFNKGGWIDSDNNFTFYEKRYLKNNMSILCHYVMDIDGVTYAIGQNGEMFDISSLNGNYRIKYGYPIIDVGTTFQPQPVFIGEAETIEWSEYDTDVITIDENGVFTAVGIGKTHISCDVVSVEGSRRHFMLEIGVDNFVTEVSIPKNMTMGVGEENKLVPTTNNTSTMFGHFSWESSNEEVATVDINGNVTAHKKGTAIITVTYDDGTGLKSSCVVSVKESNIVKVAGFTYKSRTASTVTLKWTKNTSADGYVIQQYKGGKWTTIKTITKNSTVNYKVTGLKPSVNYKFRIRAYKNSGNTKLYSTSYTTKSVKTLPSTVKSFTCKSRTASTITLKWTKNTSADGYVIQQYKGGKWTTIKTITKNSTVSYKVTGLKPSTSYKFRIKAYKKDGSSKLYGTYSTKTVRTVPSTVKSFTYKSRTAKTITLKWTKNTNADGYVIQQYKGGKWKTIKTITSKSTVNYKVAGLKKNTTYKFRIKAYKKSGSTKLYSAYATKSIKTM